jgi:ParB family chromosome partitioning protein
MTARRKPSFASLLRRTSRERDEADAAAPPGPAEGAFSVDPARVRLWPSGPAAPTPEECRDRITAIARDGQIEPVVVRPVFDDHHIEYEVIAGAADYVAVQYLHDAAIPDLELLVRVELADDAEAERLAASERDSPDVLPAVIREAFGGAVLSADAVDDLRARLEGPFAPAILATAAQIAQAQAARRGDGLPPYEAGEVLWMIEAVGQPDQASPAETLSLAIVDAGERTVTIRLEAEEALSPEMLARVVKAMIDGAAADGIAVTWGGGIE